jgi:hypothetical protein
MTAFGAGSAKQPVADMRSLSIEATDRSHDAAGYDVPAAIGYRN